MIKEICADVWELLDSNSTVCILTNNTVYGRTTDNISIAVNPMGGGIAYEALRRNPGLDRVCGEAILNEDFSLGIDYLTGAHMLRFPTIDRIGDISSLEVIENSLEVLQKYCDKYPTIQVYLPKPGCGIGGLDWETEVKPLCEKYLSNLENITIVSK